MRPTTDLVEANGHRTRVLQAGKGPAVVVLHGWGGRIESMTPVISCLQRSFHVVAMDLPGFGESPIPDAVWGTTAYAEHVAGVLAKLDVGPSNFVGHSFGANASIHIAAADPDLVRKLVLVGASGLRSAPSAKVRIKRALSKGARGLGALGGPGRRLRDSVFDRIASQDYKEAGAMRPIMVKVVNEDVSGLLPLVTAPSLLVWGTEDDAVPVRHAHRMQELIPDAGLVLFEGAGHFAYLDEPARFCRVVNHFFGARTI